MRKYIKPLLLVLIFGISACGAKNDPQQNVVLPPPAIGVTITRENCPSLETQVGMTVSWTNGDMVKLPIEILQFDDVANMTGVGKAEIGPGDIFSTKFYYAGTYRFYCSEENKDMYGVNNLTPKGGGFIPNPLGLRSMAGLQLPRQSQRTGSKLQKFYTFDAEDFMQRTIILCNLLFSIGKGLKAVVSKKNGVPYRNYNRGLN